jgi:hypothetical protein
MPAADRRDDMNYVLEIVAQCKGLQLRNYGNLLPDHVGPTQIPHASQQSASNG